MQITIRHLLTFTLACCLALAVAPYVWPNRPENSISESNRYNIRAFRYYAEFLAGSNPDLTIGELQADPKFTSTGIPFDSWGQHLQFIERNDPDASSVCKIHVYSLGPDGKSASKGNDPDDINSWDDHHQAFFDAKLKRNQRGAVLTRAICLAPPIYFALLFGWKRFLKRPQLGS